MRRGNWLVMIALGPGFALGEPHTLADEADEAALEIAAADEGSPHRLALRWRVQGAGPRWQQARAYQRLEWSPGPASEVFLLTERDPGEPRWADFTAFYARWRMGSLQVVAGDLRPGFGRGLVFGRTGGGGSTPQPSLRDDSERLGYRSSGENGSLRGLALRRTTGRLQVVVLGGWARRDARVDDSGRATSLPTSGVHVSAGERAARSRLRVLCAGLRLRCTIGGQQLGATLHEARFNLPVDLRRPGRTPWAFHGQAQRLWALDLRIDRRRAGAALEAATDPRGHRALVGVARLRLGRARLNLLLRHYDPGFYGLYGNAPSARDMRNEQGFLLLLKGRWGRQLWHVFTDQFRELAPGYHAPLPGVREVWGLSAARQLARRWRLRALFQERRSPLWLEGISHSECGRRGRLELGYDRRNGTRLDLRLEGRRRTIGAPNAGSRGSEDQATSRGGSAETGGMVSLRGRQQGRRFSAVLHLSRFLTPSYATRVYEFEYDLPGAVSIRPLYGDGWRAYILLGWRCRGLRITGRYRLQQRHQAAGALHYGGLQIDLQLEG